VIRYEIRFSGRNFLVELVPALLALQTSNLQSRIDPLASEGAQPLVVGTSRWIWAKLLCTHEVRAALSTPGIAELIVRTVLLRRVGFAAAGHTPTDPVLLREGSRAQRAECGARRAHAREEEVSGGVVDLEWLTGRFPSCRALLAFVTGRELFPDGGAAQV
jgi:hypothetical protein